jgi:hypothetical protein
LDQEEIEEHCAMSYHDVEGHGCVVECDGCGDTLFEDECEDGGWALVIIHAVGYHLCSCDCFYAWNHHVPWPGLFGERPGDELELGSSRPF